MGSKSGQKSSANMFLMPGQLNVISHINQLQTQIATISTVRGICCDVGPVDTIHTD